MIRIYFLIFTLLVFLGCSEDKPSTIKHSSTAIETSIRNIVPNGTDVSISNDIVFQFSDEVVPLGKMDRKQSDISIDIKPQVNCEWRWISRSALSCKLSEKGKLKPATNYYIKVKENVSKVDDFYIAKEYRSDFRTVLPKITYSSYLMWSEPDIPYIRLYSNIPVTRSSMKNNLSFLLSDNKSILINIIKEEEYTKDGVNFTQYSIDDSKENEVRKEWIIAPVKNIGLSQKAQLVLQNGLKSPMGKLTGQYQILREINTFPEFKYLGIECSINKQTNKCNPLKRIGLQFSSPVLTSSLKNALTLSPTLNNGLKDFDPWANQQDYSQLTYSHSKDEIYTLWLPTRLKAFTSYDVALDTSKFKDEFGRELNVAITDLIDTDHRAPKLKMAHQNVVLEKDIDSDIPLYATNLDNIKIDYTKLLANNATGKSSANIQTQKIEDISYKTKMGIRKILDGNSGAIYGSVTTSSIDKDYPRNIFAQVTPFQAHAKLGHFNSLIWVTDFANAKPISNAKVTILSGYFNKIDNLIELPYSGVTDQNGLVQLAGTEEIDKKLNDLGWLSKNDKRFFIKIEKDNDIALLPLDNNFKIKSYGTYSSMHQYGQYAKAWGTTAQGVYKVGDKVEYKIYVRDQNNTTLISPDKYHFSLKVVDPLDKLVYEHKDFQLNEYGTFSESFNIPKEGAVGKYKFKLSQVRTVSGTEFKYYWSPMNILVSDFTPAAFSVKVDLNGEKFKIDNTLKISSEATMYSGGPYGNAEARITAHLFEKRFKSNHKTAKGFTFGGDNYKELELLNIKEMLDSQGQNSKELKLKDTGIYYGQLFIETSVKDERGKYVSSNSKAIYSQLDRFVGLKDTKWIYKKGEESAVNVLVVDENGKPVKGTNTNIDIQYKEYKASRVKGSGNAFVTVNSSKWISESSCSLTSTEDISKCKFMPKNIGNYKFIATVKDSKGNIHKSTLNSWVSGYSSVVWDSNNDSTLQIIPENNTYKLGQTARYLIKNPFPGAKALVTVERYGILDSWVQTLDTNTPIIEVPIKHEYLPGFYLSVTVLSPRVEKPLGEGIVDLGKPSYKMGYTKTTVKDTYKELEVKITTDKEVYAPQDEATVIIHVNEKTQEPNAEYELAVVAIDESVFALNKQGNKYYDPYLGFNSLSSLDVTNFSLISRLIGRQKFEKKGANQGGDGGKTTALSDLRDDFKYIAYWNPNIITQDNGHASMSIKLPDNLTGWKIFVLAVGKNDTMGVGNTKFKTNKSTEIRPVMPNQVLVGDTFSAGFNVMNRTGKVRDLKVTMELDGLEDKVRSKVFQFKLEPFARKNIYMPVEAKNDGMLTFKIAASDKYGSDNTLHKLVVNKRTSLETMANFGSSLSDSISENIHIPKNIIPNVGKVGVTLSTSVIANIDGSFKYIKDYPYWCWEQRLTKAVAAAHYDELNEYISESFKWNDSKDLVKRMIKDSSTFQAPNGGMAFWVGANEYTSPYLSAYTALEFQWLKDNGYQIAFTIEKNLLKYLKNILSKENFPSYYSSGMSSTVRAVALNALSKSDSINKDDVSRYYRHYKKMSLFGKANYLQSMINIQGIEASIKKEVLNSILSASSQSAGKFQFNEEYDDGSSYLLATPMRTNCAILSTIVSAENDQDLKDSVKDIAPKIVRTITQKRGNKDHWENTQENSFCMKALVDYSKVYEREVVSMNVKVQYDKEEIGEIEFTSKKDSNAEVFTELKQKDIGKKTTLNISKKGTGRLYYISRISYAPEEALVDRVNSGIEIIREYSIEKNGQFEILKNPMNIKQGDIVRVDLFLSLPTARHFVVVNDHIPGGLEPINSDFATTSVMDAKKGDFKPSKDSWWFNFSDWSSYGRYNWSFYHKELRHGSARFYSDYLPAGNYHLSYTTQAIAKGKFSIMPSHAEEMYGPDVYGKSLPAALNITSK